MVDETQDKIVLAKLLYAIENLNGYADCVKNTKQLKQALDCLVMYIVENASVDVLKLEQKLRHTSIEKIIEID